VSGDDKAQGDPLSSPSGGTGEAPAGQPGWPPPPQGAWGQPPQGAWGQPPQGAWGQPPQGAWPPPPQGAWPPPPQGAWPPPPQGAWPPPPQGAWGPFRPAYMGPAGPVPGFVWAGLTVRFGALAIDAGIMFVALIVASMAAEAFGVEHTYYEDYYSAGAQFTYLLWFASFILYQPLCWWTFQGTPGQRVLGLRVVRAADGTPLGLGPTLGRFAVWAVCQVTVILAIIAAAAASDEAAKQTWWDKASGSVVVQRL